MVDVNDNSPKIDVPRGCVSISEFHDIRDIIALVKVVDADDPMTPNGRVKLRIISGNELGSFSNYTVHNFIFYLRILYASKKSPESMQKYCCSLKIKMNNRRF